MNQLKGNSSHFPLLLVSCQDNGVFGWHHWGTANITHSLQINEKTSSNKLPTKDHWASKVVGHGIRASYAIWGTQWKMQMQGPLFKNSGKRILPCSTVCLSSCHGVFFILFQGPFRMEEIVGQMQETLEGTWSPAPMVSGGVCPDSLSYSPPLPPWAELTAVAGWVQVAENPAGGCKRVGRWRQSMYHHPGCSP